MLVTFLFWNMMKRPLQERIARMVAAHSVDIVMLAECSESPDDVLVALNANAPPVFHYPPTLSTKLHVFTRYNRASVADVFNDPVGGLTIRRLEFDSNPAVLLALVHFASRVNYDQDDQTLEATSLAADIRGVEAIQAIDRTIVVGDFNMNPFEPGMAGAQALHAMMTKNLARREERDVRGRPYSFFYNPMWGHFGDRTDGPPATYYLRASKPYNLFWHMYDQVLLRPSLMDSLRELHILDTDGVEPLLTRNDLPSTSSGSDHLPLLFSIEL